jgi:hypothetical protein
VHWLDDGGAITVLGDFPIRLKPAANTTNTTDTATSTGKTYGPFTSIFQLLLVIAGGVLVLAIVALMCCMCLVLARRRKQQQRQEQEQQHDPVHDYGVEPLGGRRPRPRGRADLESHSEGKQRRGHRQRPRSGGMAGRYAVEVGPGSPREPATPGRRNNWFQGEEDLGRSAVVTPPSYRQGR